MTDDSDVLVFRVRSTAQVVLWSVMSGNWLLQAAGRLSDPSDPLFIAAVMLLVVSVAMLVVALRMKLELHQDHLLLREFRVRRIPYATMTNVALNHGDSAASSAVLVSHTGGKPLKLTVPNVRDLAHSLQQHAQGLDAKQTNLRPSDAQGGDQNP